MSSSWKRRHQDNITSLPVDMHKISIKDDIFVLSTSTPTDVKTFTLTAHSDEEPNSVSEEGDNWYDYEICATNSGSTTITRNPESALETRQQVSRNIFKPGFSRLLTGASKAVMHVATTTITRAWKKAFSYYQPRNLARHPRVWAIRIASRKLRIHAKEIMRNQFGIKRRAAPVIWKSDRHAVAHLTLHRRRNGTRDKRKIRWNFVRVQEEIKRRGNSGLRYEVSRTLEGKELVKRGLHETISKSGLRSKRYFTKETASLYRSIYS